MLTEGDFFNRLVGQLCGGVMKLFCKGLLFFVTLVLLASSAQAEGLALDKYRGKIVYLDFWASWCEPCRKSFPFMKKLQAELGSKGLVVVAVNVDSERKAADAFLRRFPVNFELVFDSQGKIAGEYNLAGMPASFLLDREGKTIDSHLGFSGNAASEIRQKIEAALNK